MLNHQKSSRMLSLITNLENSSRIKSVQFQLVKNRRIQFTGHRDYHHNQLHNSSTESELKSKNFLKVIRTKTNFMNGYVLIRPVLNYYHGLILCKKNNCCFYSSSSNSSHPNDSNSNPSRQENEDEEVSEHSIKKILTQKFPDGKVSVEDVSGGCGTFFTIQVIDKSFEETSTFNQHKLINKTLSRVIPKIHGLQINTRSTE
ncbi:bola protein [Phakopsora pachyrhizi]|nr:bola protein [Phakopsora pachyrhizi]